MRNCRIIVTTLLLAGTTAAQDMGDVKVKTTKVAGNVYVLEGRGGNIGLSIGADGVLMIDDQFAPLADKIRAAIKELGGDLPKFVLNTHWHGDHTGGNEVFGKAGSTIIAHANVRTRVSTGQDHFGQPKGPLDPVGWPVITFRDGLSIHFNGEEVRVLHLPHGHTDGDSVVFFPESNVVHMGDDMFNEMFPFVDLEHGGDVEGLTANVDAVLKLMRPNMKVIPGHGPVTDLKGLQTYHAMLVDCIETVRKQVDAGKSLEAIQAQGLDARWDAWGKGFIKTDKWIATIHTSLTR